MRVVVTGAAGMLGSAVVRQAKRMGHDVIGIYRKSGASDGMVLDLLEESAPSTIIDRAPSWIIHCAAIVDVDWCQDHVAQSFATNCDVPARIAAAAARSSIGFVQISTDSVFDGVTGQYTEDDEPGPMNVYAETKRAAELSVMRASGEHIILRTNLFGVSGRPRPSLAEWIVRRLTKGENLSGFTDVRFSPLLVDDLAGLLFATIDSGLRGLFHAGAANSMSKFHFARALAVELGLDPELVRPSLAADTAFNAPRPRDTSLNSSRLAGLLGSPMPAIEAGIARLVRSSGARLTHVDV